MQQSHLSPHRHCSKFTRAIFFSFCSFSNLVYSAKQATHLPSKELDLDMRTVLTETSVCFTCMLYKLADLAVRSGSRFRSLDDHQYGLLAAVETDERLTVVSDLGTGLIGIILLLGVKLILPTAIILGLVWQPFWRLFDLEVVCICSFLNVSP